MDEQPDDVFATRTLEVDGVPCFHLRVFKPFPEDGGAYWRCAYAVSGPLTQYVGSACAEDGMQALLFAIYMLREEAHNSAEHEAGRLAWSGQSEHFGLPSIDNDPGIIELRKRREAGPE